jgi:hypothetical protein
VRSRCERVPARGKRGASTVLKFALLLPLSFRIAGVRRYWVRSSNGGNVHLHKRAVCRSQRRDMSLAATVHQRTSPARRRAPAHLELSVRWGMRKIGMFLQLGAMFAASLTGCAATTLQSFSAGPRPANRVPDRGVWRCIRARGASAPYIQPGWLSWSNRLTPKIRGIPVLEIEQPMLTPTV